MIRTLILLALLAVMVAIARSHPGVLPEAAQSAGAAIEKQVREAEKQVEKAVAAAKPIVSDVLSPARAPEPPPRPVTSVATPKPKTDDQAPLPPEPFLMPRGAAGPDLPAAPPTPVERAPIPAEKSAKPVLGGLPGPSESPAPPGANIPVRPIAPSAADRASEARVQTLLRDAARILAETELPK